jgi:hypothetical protein
MRDVPSAWMTVCRGNDTLFLTEALFVSSCDPQKIEKSIIQNTSCLPSVASSSINMAPVLSKPSDTAKKFIVRANVKEGRVIGIRISSDEMKAALHKASISYQAMVNKNLKEAEVNRVANAIIQAALDGEVSARRGNGRDTADKAFYKGDGSIDGPGGLFFRNGVFTCSEKMYDRARDMVAKTIGVKLSELKEEGSVKEEVPGVIHAPEKLKALALANNADTVCAISVGSAEETKTAQGSFKDIGIKEKACLFDLFFGAHTKGK